MQADSAQCHLAELSILKQLQQCYKEIRLQHDLYVTSISEVNTSVEAVLNLMEQLTCSRKVDIKNTPLATFPDLPERLHMKLIALLEEKLEQVTNSVNKMREGSAKVDKTSTACINMYRAKSNKLNIDQLSKAYPTRPSVASLLEWTQDAQYIFRSEYSRRRNLLHGLSYDNETSVDRLAKGWKSMPNLQHLSDDILPSVSMFLKEDLSG